MTTRTDVSAATGRHPSVSTAACKYRCGTWQATNDYEGDVRSGDENGNGTITDDRQKSSPARRPAADDSEPAGVTRVSDNQYRRSRLTCPCVSGNCKANKRVTCCTGPCETIPQGKLEDMCVTQACRVSFQRTATRATPLRDNDVRLPNQRIRHSASIQTCEDKAEQTSGAQASAC